MFLLQIKNDTIRNKNELLQIKQLKTLKRKYQRKLKFLSKTKQTKTSKFLGLNLKNKIYLNKLVKYVIGVSFLTTNLNVYITNIKGDVIYLSSAGSVNIRGKQKQKKSLVLTKLLQVLILQAKFIGKSPVVLHLKNFTDFYVSLVLSILKKHFIIEVVKVLNNKPYNGCRPRKLKRKKRRKLKF